MAVGAALLALVGAGVVTGTSTVTEEAGAPGSTGGPPPLPTPAATPPPPSADEAPRAFYDVLFEARLSPTERAAHVRIGVNDPRGRLHSIRLSIDPARHTGFEGDGLVEVGERSVTWTPPHGGGELRYLFRIDHLRDERSYDARCAASWALFRGDDLFPPVRARYEKGADSRSRLRLRLPEGWSAAVAYPRLRGGDYRVEDPDRHFDRPTGWMTFGNLGVVREEVAGTRVAVAGPARHGLHRLDILAMLRWTLPELDRTLGRPMGRLLVVGAGDPMWRGGLSGPRSIFLHSERPLIDDDGTSPLLHELVHVAMNARADDDADFLVEGIAEYYSLSLLERTGTLSKERYEKALARAAAGGQKAAQARTTARGVALCRELDLEIRRRTQGARSLDDVLRVLVASREKLTIERFRQALVQGSGLPLDELPVKALAEAAPPPPKPDPKP